MSLIRLVSLTALLSVATALLASPAAANAREEKSAVNASVDARLHALLGKLARQAQGGNEEPKPGVEVASR